MKNPLSHIKKIFVDKECLDLPYTKQILDRADTIPVETINGHQLPGLSSSPYVQSLSEGKKTLLLCRNHGHFFKACPATREYQCCDYQVINIGMNCPMDCVYCILQAYLNNPWLSFFVNTDTLFAELSKSFSSEPDRLWRIGTGEFTDSMALDQLTGLSAMLVDFFKDKHNAVLELKTKSAVIENLEGLDHRDRTIVSWSLNSPEIMKKEELRTATLDERLAAAAQCADWGYKLGFHFDPIIYHPDWRSNYSKTINKLFEAVPAVHIAWISVGALRFLPNLKNIAAERFPNSKFFYEEFIIGLDSKHRYFRTQRVEMYKHIYRELAQHASPKTCIYLCMESDEIWQEVFGYTPGEQGGLPAILDRSIFG